jgi:hypothetical protein
LSVLVLILHFLFFTEDFSVLHCLKCLFHWKPGEAVSITTCGIICTKYDRCEDLPVDDLSRLFGGAKIPSTIPIAIVSIDQIMDYIFLLWHIFEMNWNISACCSSTSGDLATLSIAIE